MNAKAKQEEKGANASKKLNLFQRIRNVMLEVEYVRKEDKRVNNQYTFVSHDAVTAKLHMPMAKNGIVMLPSVKSVTREGDKGMRTVVIVEMTFINIDEPEDRFSIDSVGYGIDNQDKGIGKAVSYAVKYGLLKTFGLETGDDPERDMIDIVEEKLTENECVKIVEALLLAPEGTEDKMLEWLKVDKLADVPRVKFNSLMGMLGKKAGGE